MPRSPRPSLLASALVAIAVRLALMSLNAYALEATVTDADDAPHSLNELPSVDVVDTAPLPGLPVNISQIPANVQTIDARQIQKSHPVDSSEALERNLGSVNLNDSQGGPLQADVNFRGFTASPVLGTPQGISVFVDGVRVNEAFGDTVNWDLIPTGAISRITVVPGSNPVFGLNTLGGALAVSTKSGFEFPGTSAMVQAGSWGRKTVEVDSGGHGEDLEYFVSGRVTNDSGWADHNPSRLRQLFGKGGWQNGDTDVDASLTVADNYAEGNQSLPLSLFDNTHQIYSYPDYQRNKIWFGNVQVSHTLAPQQVIAADVYLRSVRSFVFNSNVNKNYVPPASPGNYPGQNITNGIDQTRLGASFQYNGITRWQGHDNNLTVGASADRGTVDFTQFAQDALVSADRGTFSSLPMTPAVGLNSSDANVGAYASDLFTIAPTLSVTAAGRFNQSVLHMVDQLGTSLNGDHQFSRFNPSVGLNFNPTPTYTAYMSYNEGMRAPTPVELSCANPSAPCSLPNAFNSDPDLKPVVAKTLELGARGKFSKTLSWTSAIFRSKLSDDIQFISSGGGATSAGYFQNVGQTQRQGLELGLTEAGQVLSWRANYTFTQATFRTPLILNSPANSTAAPLTCPTCADILVLPGDRMPGVPLHILKLDVDYAPSERWGVGANVIAQSSTYARGDENNQDINGPVPGFALFNVTGQVQVHKGIDVFAKIDNVFNRLYSTFGTLGVNAFHLPGHAFDSNPNNWPAEQFRSVGPGRGAWLGISYHLD
jgi:outer membrane receptor protein involved in Fe transport